MDCQQALALINALVDGEIGGDEGALLEAHLATCDDCRETHELLKSQNADLRELFASRREIAGAIADRVIGELTAAPPVAAVPSRRSPGLLSLLLATAVGFLTAVVIFQPWKSELQPIEFAGPAQPIPVEPVRLAQFAAATGAIEFRTEQDTEWLPVSNIASFQCPTDASVRTSYDGRCELVTSDDCVIRMNGDSEVRLRSPSSVELRRGQIWCKSPDNVTLEVTPAMAESEAVPPAPAATASAWSCTTPGSASFLTTLSADGNARVSTDGGEVSLKTLDGDQRLKPGETATIEQGRIAGKQPHDQLLSLSWMAPLMVSKGHDDKDLQRRVDELLARIGETKLSSLYEQEIRGLGEYCVLPLLRYLQSPTSQEQPARRMRAMRIVSDLAPAWAAGDLIGLLDDDDANVRFLAATALFRLTEQNLGCTPAAWHDGSSACEETRKNWEAWWNANRERYPMPTTR